MTSAGVHRSGTGSQIKIGFSRSGCSSFRFWLMVVTRLMHLNGEQIKWNDFDSRRVSVRESASRRSFGVVYRKPLVWFSS